MNTWECIYFRYLKTQATILTKSTFLDKLKIFSIFLFKANLWDCIHFRYLEIWVKPGIPASTKYSKDLLLQKHLKSKLNQN